MSEEFLIKMLNSYPHVHNNRYWNEITPILDKHGQNRPTIMDLGCGPGLLLSDLTNYLNPGKVIGIDMSPIMLERARREITKRIEKLIKQDIYTSASDVELILTEQHLQDNHILPQNIDFIFSSRVLRSFEDQELIMNSIYSSLNKEGIFVLLDWTKNSIIEYEKWFRSGRTIFDKEMNKWDVIRYHRNFSRYGLQDWHYILEVTGFEVIHQFQVDPVHNCIIGKKPKK